MGALAREFAGTVPVAFVYVREAHATDEWPIASAAASSTGEPIHIAQPTTTEARCDIASRFAAAEGLDTASLQLLVDGADNAFERAYAPWPLRLFGLRSGSVGFVAEPRDGQYDLGELRVWMAAEAARLS